MLTNVTLTLLAAYVRGWLLLRPVSQGSANATAAEGENSLKMVMTSHCVQVGLTYFFAKTSNIDFTLTCIWVNFFLRVRCRRRMINYRRLFLNFVWNVILNLEQQYIWGFIFTRLRDKGMNDYASF
jgi:hypothetical protein